jgi:hypothetical protein
MLRIKERQKIDCFQVWSYVKQKGFISKKDPIPYNALIYYAIDKGFCKNELIDEDGKSPDICYQLALVAAKNEVLVLGRK